MTAARTIPRACVVCRERPPMPNRAHGVCAECVLAEVRRSTAAQGVPEKVTDPVALRKVATIANASRSTAEQRGA